MKNSPLLYSDEVRKRHEKPTRRRVTIEVDVSWPVDQNEEQAIKFVRRELTKAAKAIEERKGFAARVNEESVTD